MKRLIITGLAMSSPGTMGGNTKIALEVARFFSKTIQAVVIIQKDKIKTITDNIEINDNIQIYPIEPFHHTSLIYLFHDTWHYTKELEKAFTVLSVQPGEPVFNCSDFLAEAFSSFWLKPKFRFTWIPSTFLFFPSPWENLTRRYGFPLFLYTLAYIYQRIIFQFIKLRGDLFVITNDCDKAYFPVAWQQRIFAFYGGVNSEQIQSLAQEQIETKYDVVFCSRLCTQKGIMPFLDIWSRVIQQLPAARLAIIGNGVPTFEKSLQEKANKLKLAHTITWLGYVNNRDKYRVYRASRLFVHPTVYDNNGMVAAEALCAGLPVVMNDLPSLREVYTTGCSKIDFSDYDATAQRIAHLLTEPTIYQQLKPTQQQVAVLNDYWDWTNRCKQFERFIKK